MILAVSVTIVVVALVVAIFATLFDLAVEGFYDDPIVVFFTAWGVMTAFGFVLWGLIALLHWVWSLV